jgi:hypothetical protein
MANMIHTILVPQGAEYQAVCRGLRGVLKPPQVWALPVGAAAGQRLVELHHSDRLFPGQTVLILGLCGALTAEFAVGDAVLYAADSALTQALQQQLQVPLVCATTSDRVIATPADKQQLARSTGAQVVDMEAASALAVLTEIGAEVATLRVVSDSCDRPIPNLAHAFTPAGNLKPLALAAALLSQPQAALNLVRGSLRGLAALQQVTAQLVQP